MLKKVNIIVLILLILFSISNTYSKPETLIRKKIDKKYKWDLSDIYSSWAQWEKELKEFTKKMNKFTNYKNQLSKNADTLYKALKLHDQLNKLSYKLYWYPKLHFDTNQRNQTYSKYYQKAIQVLNKFEQKSSWFRPEILSIGKEKINNWLKNYKKLNPYNFYLKKLYRQQKHVLNEEKEKLLSFYSPIMEGLTSIYPKLSNADMDYPKLKLSNGKEVTLTSSKYSEILKNDNLTQSDRKKAYIKYNKLYQDNKYTYAALLKSITQKDWAQAKARGYENTLKANLFENKIPVSVYKNLIEVARNNSDIFKKYYKLEKKIIKNRKKLDTYWAYDTGLNFTKLNKKYPYDKAKKWIYKSVTPLGDDYPKKIKKAIENRWIDVYRNKGKAKGAYNIGVYGVHPYMLLNYNDEMSDMFSLAHELGHAIHDLYAFKNQPFINSNATIFIAEIASTFNEKLLLNYLLKMKKDPRERIALLREAIDQIAGTFYFQTYLADFALQIHQRTENNKPLTLKYFKKLDKNLDNKYFGNYSKEYKDFSRYTWTYISHLYDRPFYVYQYATCFASSAQFYKDITTGTKKSREKAKKRYIELLKSGGDDYPMKQLREAGVDLRNKKAFRAVAQQFRKLVNKLEKEVNKLDKLNS